MSLAEVQDVSLFVLGPPGGFELRRMVPLSPLPLLLL